MVGRYPPLHVRPRRYAENGSGHRFGTTGNRRPAEDGGGDRADRRSLLAATAVDDDVHLSGYTTFCVRCSDQNPRPKHRTDVMHLQNRVAEQAWSSGTTTTARGAPSSPGAAPFVAVAAVEMG